MLRHFAPLIAALAALLLSACSGDTGDPTMDVGGSIYDDIPAKEMQAYTPVEDQFCVGQYIDPSFAEYDYQCEAALGKGKCVQMPNPHDGKTYYCTLCGYKGSKMVCYFINKE